MGRCTSHLVDLKYATINIFILDLLICIMNHMIYCCVRFISGVYVFLMITNVNILTCGT